MSIRNLLGTAQGIRIFCNSVRQARDAVGRLEFVKSPNCLASVTAGDERGR